MHFATGDAIQWRPFLHGLHVRFGKQQAGRPNDNGHLNGGRRYDGAWRLYVRLRELTVAAADLARVGGWVGEAGIAWLPTTDTNDQVSYERLHFIEHGFRQFRIGCGGQDGALPDCFDEGLCVSLVSLLVASLRSFNGSNCVPFSPFPSALSLANDEPHNAQTGRT